MNPKMRIERYLVEELKLNSGIMLDIFEKITKYDDIMNDFYKWLQVRNYDYEDPLTVNGYTAKDIYGLNHNLDGIGVYNFLITLREEPEKAQAYIDEGFQNQ